MATELTIRIRTEVSPPSWTELEQDIEDLVTEVLDTETPVLVEVLDEEEV